MATIKKRGSTYSVIYDYIDEFGKRRQKWESGLTRDESEDRKAEIENDKRQKQFVNPNSMTVADYFDRWTPVHARKRWTYSTYTTNTALIKNHILPHIGLLKLQALTTQDLDLLYDTLSRKPKGGCKNESSVVSQGGLLSTKNAKCLSSTTIKEVHDILRSALAKAVEWKILKENPIPAEGPKKNLSERAIWDEQTMFRALSLMDNPLLHLAVHCTYICSLRIGELAAITMKDIDLRSGKLFINKTLQRASKDALEAQPDAQLIKIFPTTIAGKKSCLILKEPKTPRSKRYIFMTCPLKEEIQKRIVQIQQDKDDQGELYNDYGLLFCLPNGNPIEPKLLEKWFTLWQEEKGGQFPPLVFHGIRHSSTTYKLDVSDGDYKSVQGDTGIADTDILLNTYGHIQDKSRESLAKTIEDRFYQKKSVPANEDQVVNLLLASLGSDPQMQTKLLLALLAQGGAKNDC